MTKAREIAELGQKLTVDGSGNLDIAGDITSDGLTVDGNPILNNASPQLMFQTGASHYNWQIAAQESTNAAFEIAVGSQDGDATNDTYSPKVTVVQSGKVGINTTAPAAFLEVKSGNNEQFKITGTDTNPTTLMMDYNNGGSSKRVRIKNDDGDLKFATNNGNDRLTITEEGSVGVNKTSPSSSYKLDISGNMRLTGTAGTIRLEADDTSLDTDQLVGRVEMYANDGSTGGTGVAGFMEVKSDDQYGVNTYMTLGTRISDGTGNATERFRITKQGGFISKPTTDGVVVLNQNGADADFRVESSANSNMLVVNAGTNRFGVGVSPAHLLHASGTQSGDWISLIENTHTSNGYGLKVKAGDNNDVQPFRVANTSNDTLFYVAGGGRVVFNDVQNTTGDVNIKGNTMSGLFYADVSTNRIGINTATPNSLLQVNGEAEFNRARVVDNGSSSPLFNIKSDDASPWAFQIQNDSYSATENYGLRTYVDNGGNAVTQLKTSNNAIYRFQSSLDSSTKETIRFDHYSVNINDDSNDLDFRVESDSNANMLTVDASENRVYVGTGSPSAGTNTSLEVTDIMMGGVNIYQGRVPNTANDNSGFVKIFNLTGANNSNIGCNFSARVYVQSYTGFSMANVSFHKHYIQDTINFTVTDYVDGFGNQSGVSLSLVTATVDGDSWLGIRKTGGGTGQVYIDGYVSGGSAVLIREERSSNYTVTTTHGTIIA